MGMSRKVTKWESKDGSLHASREEADRTDRYLAMKEWYEEDDQNWLFGEGLDGRVKFDDILDFVRAHKHSFLRLI